MHKLVAPFYMCDCVRGVSGRPTLTTTKIGEVENQKTQGHAFCLPCTLDVLDTKLRNCHRGTA